MIMPFEMRILKGLDGTPAIPPFAECAKDGAPRFVVGMKKAKETWGTRQIIAFYSCKCPSLWDGNPCNRTDPAKVTGGILAHLQKNKMKIPVYLLFVVLATYCCVLSGCGGNVNDGNTQSSPTITDLSVSCSPGSILTTQTSVCTASVQGTGAYSSGVTWSATNGTITSNGVFTPTSAGTATIMATSLQDTTKFGAATVAVSVPITITSVTVTCSPAAIVTTQTSVCTASVQGTGAYSSGVTWSATNGTITSNGVFTPTSAGTATIMATSLQDTTKFGATVVTVANATTLEVALPHLAVAMANYNFTTQPSIYIAAFGSSVGGGGNLPNPALQAVCGHFVADLKAKYPGPGGLGYNFTCVNESVNGSKSSDFPAAWIEYTTYALSGVTINTPGSGYAVGDAETVNQGTNASGGAIIVTAVSAGGVPTAIAISAYPGCIGSTPNLYSVATNVLTINGPPSMCPVTIQTGTGSGLTVNITSVGYPNPAVALFVYGMNDETPLAYNSGETLQGGLSAMLNAVQTIQSASADAVILTSIHPSVVWWGADQWAWDTASRCTYPEFMTICDSSDLPNPSEVDSTVSATKGDLAQMGTEITVSSRMLKINTEYRELSAQYNTPMIDAELYWFYALETETAALGSQLAAEQTMFDVAGPHPNLLGEQLGYQRAIDEFFQSIAP
jgi:hypothetical protein